MADCKLVIFDCDGTLMDSEVIAARAETEIMAEYGIEIGTDEFMQRFAGTSSTFVKTTMEAESGRHFPDDHFDKVKLKMHELLWREVKVVDGTHAMLDALDYPRCICSNAGMEKLKLELTRGELWDRFRPYVYSAKDLEGVEQKPAPDLFLHAAKEFEAAPESVVVIEDSVPGVQAGVAAGMLVIGSTAASHCRPGHGEMLMEAGAVTTVSRLADLPKTIDGVMAWGGSL